MPKEKFYAVKVGRVPGIYPSYTECYQQIKGISNAIHGSFPTTEEAEAFIRGDLSLSNLRLLAPEGKHYDIFTGGSFVPSAPFTDARYSSAFVVYEADSLIHIGKAEGTDKESAIKHQGITGEVEAVIKAVTWAEGLNVPITIRYSFTGIINWLSGDWKAKDKLAQGYVEFIKAREGWVKFNKVDSPSDIDKHDKAKKLAREILDK